MALLEDSLTQAGATHFTNFNGVPVNGAVAVVIAGQHQRQYVDCLNMDLSRYSKVALFVVGDEENLFPLREVQHQNIKFFVQTPKPGQYDDCEKLLVGYPPIIYKPRIEKTLDWFFAGQVTHERRHECVDVLRFLQQNGVLIPTAGFTQGISRIGYLDCMASAKVIPCPSGVCSPDSFRFAESLECGCIPVVDGRSPRSGYEGFWNYVFDSPNLPFPIIDSWSEFPQILNSLLENWEQKQAKCQQWWNQYKTDLIEKLKRI